MKKWLKAELHAHTREDPEDGERMVRHSAQDLIDRAAQLGYSVLSITNHNQLFFDPDLESYAQRRGVILIPGVEATLEGRHVLLYNFPEYQPDWKDPETVRRHKAPGRLVVAPHPYFPVKSALRGRLELWQDLFDAVEYSGFYLKGINFNRRAELFALESGLPLVGNSDVHFLFQLGPTYTRIYAERRMESILDAVRQGDVELVSQPAGSSYVARWLLFNGLFRLRYLPSSLLSRLSRPLSAERDSRRWGERETFRG